jgi:hypothetical protein
VIAEETTVSAGKSHSDTLSLSIIIHLAFTDTILKENLLSLNAKQVGVL